MSHKRKSPDDPTAERDAKDAADKKRKTEADDDDDEDEKYPIDDDSDASGDREVAAKSSFIHPQYNLDAFFETFQPDLKKCVIAPALLGTLVERKKVNLPACVDRFNRAMEALDKMPTDKPALFSMTERASSRLTPSLALEENMTLRKGFLELIRQRGWRVKFGYNGDGTENDDIFQVFAPSF